MGIAPVPSSHRHPAGEDEKHLWLGWLDAAVSLKGTSFATARTIWNLPRRWTRMPRAACPCPTQTSPTCSVPPSFRWAGALFERARLGKAFAAERAK